MATELNPHRMVTARDAGLRQTLRCCSAGASSRASWRHSSSACRSWRFRLARDGGFGIFGTYGYRWRSRDGTFYPAIPIIDSRIWRSTRRSTVGGAVPCRLRPPSRHPPPKRPVSKYPTLWAAYSHTGI
jgi:hypothetical protein